MPEVTGSFLFCVLGVCENVVNLIRDLIMPVVPRTESAPAHEEVWTHPAPDRALQLGPVPPT